LSGFLLDTNVISELLRPRPAVGVTRWLNSVDEQKLFLSALTIGEIQKGISLLQQSRRRDTLESWLKVDLPLRFGPRIISVNEATAIRWGRASADAQLRGTPLSAVDGLIASTALEYGLTLVTRNVKDFAGTGVALVNPWV